MLEKYVTQFYTLADIFCMLWIKTKSISPFYALSFHVEKMEALHVFFLLDIKS